MVGQDYYLKAAVAVDVTQAVAEYLGVMVADRNREACIRDAVVVVAVDVTLITRGADDGLQIAVETLPAKALAHAVDTNLVRIEAGGLMRVEPLDYANNGGCLAAAGRSGQQDFDGAGGQKSTFQ